MNLRENYNKLQKIESELIEKISQLAKQLENIQNAKNELINELKKTMKTNIEFVDKKHAVQYGTKNILLTKLQYKLVLTLWNAPKRRLKTHLLCQKIWGNTLLSDETFRKTRYRINEKLETENFPYQIKAIKSLKDKKEILGYGLRKIN
jgi:DNA-binding response OmpR family regulator